MFSNKKICPESVFPNKKSFLELVYIYEKENKQANKQTHEKKKKKTGCKENAMWKKFPGSFVYILSLTLCCNSFAENKFPDT